MWGAYINTVAIMHKIWEIEINSINWKIYLMIEKITHYDELALKRNVWKTALDGNKHTLGVFKEYHLYN